MTRYDRQDENCFQVGDYVIARLDKPINYFESSEMRMARYLRAKGTIVYVARQSVEVKFPKASTTWVYNKSCVKKVNVNDKIR